MTTDTVGAQGAVRHPGFFDQLNAEWTKLRSQRSFFIEIALALGVSPAMTALICLAIGSSFNDLNPAEQASFDPVLIGFVGTAFGSIVLIVLGVTFTSSEYTSGMVRLSFTATPQRGRWLGAKAMLVLVVCLAVGLPMVVVSFFVGQAVLGSYEGVPTAAIGDDGVLRAVLGAWLTMPVWPLIGAALGVVLRSTAAAITSTLVFLFAPSIFGGLFPEWWRQNVLAYLPGNAGDSLLVVQRTPGNFYLDPGVAVAVLIAWLIGFYSVAYLLLKRRDV